MSEQLQQPQEQSQQPLFGIEKIYLKDMSLELPNAPRGITGDIILAPEVAAVAGQHDCGVSNDPSESRHPAPYSSEMVPDNLLEQMILIFWSGAPRPIRCWDDA